MTCGCFQDDFCHLWSFLEKTSTKEAFCELKSRFEDTDVDGDGRLDAAELERLILVGLDFQVSKAYLTSMFKTFDTDRNGTICFDEFCHLWAFLEKSGVAPATAVATPAAESAPAPELETAPEAAPEPEVGAGAGAGAASDGTPEPEPESAPEPEPAAEGEADAPPAEARTEEEAWKVAITMFNEVSSGHPESTHLLGVLHELVC